MPKQPYKFADNLRAGDRYYAPGSETASSVSDSMLHPSVTGSFVFVLNEDGDVEQIPSGTIVRIAESAGEEWVRYARSQMT